MMAYLEMMMMMMMMMMMLRLLLIYYLWIKQQLGTVVCLIATKFEPFIFSVLSFPLACVANNYIFMISVIFAAGIRQGA
jgi:hypothetical protein